MKIYQIEISNHCNLSCSYCPHPAQGRAKGLMSSGTFEQTLELLVRCGQRTAYLHNFGEPLLHPELARFVRRCTERRIKASFFTNGTLITSAILTDLADAGLRFLHVSEHTKGEIARVREAIEQTGVPIELRETFRPIRAKLHDWASQVESGRRIGREHRPEDALPCLFERQHAAVVLWDGRVNVCCIDAEGLGVRGTVADYLAEPASYRFRPIELCSSCSLMRGEEDLS